MFSCLALLIVLFDVPFCDRPPINGMFRRTNIGECDGELAATKLEYDLDYALEQMAGESSAALSRLHPVSLELRKFKQRFLLWVLSSLRENLTTPA